MFRKSIPTIDITAVTNDPFELTAYKKTASGAKTLPVKMDADGCFYGFRFNLLVKNIVLVFGDKLQHVENLGQAQRDELIYSIFELIQTANIESWSSTDTRKRPEFERKVPDNLLHFFIKKIKLLHPNLLYEILYRVNRPLVERIMAEAKRDQCEVVAFLFFTSRNTLDRDISNAHRNGTGFFIEDLHYFTRYLNHLFHHEMLFLLDRFMMPDAYNDLPSGETFRKAFASLSKPDEKQVHPGSAFVPSKVDNMLCVHRVKLIFPGAERVLAFDDNTEEVTDALGSIFQHDHCRQLLPNGLPVTIIFYDGDFCNEAPDVVISGNGEIDLDFGRNLRHLLKLSAGCDIADLPANRQTINLNNPDLLAKLQAYLQESRKLAWLVNTYGSFFVSPQIGEQTGAELRLSSRLH